MLEIVIMLVIIALVLLFLRAGRQNTIIYRKKVAPPDRGYSIEDHPSASGPAEAPGCYSENEPQTGHRISEPFAFGGGDFGGGGAGDSYNLAANDVTATESGSFDDFGSELNGFDLSSSSDPASYDCDSYGSGATDSDSGDSSSDSGSDSSGTCSD